MCLSCAVVLCFEHARISLWTGGHHNAMTMLENVNQMIWRGGRDSHLFAIRNDVVCTKHVVAVSISGWHGSTGLDNLAGIIHLELSSFDIVGEITLKESKVIIGSIRLVWLWEILELTLVECSHQNAEKLQSLTVERFPQCTGFSNRGSKNLRGHSGKDGPNDGIQFLELIRHIYINMRDHVTQCIFCRYGLPIHLQDFILGALYS